MNARSINDLVSDEHGSVLVEATILVPVLFVLVFGVFEFSNYFLQQHIVSTGVRDAARYMARTNPTDATAETTAKNIAVYGSPLSGGTPRVQGWTPDDVDIVPIAISNLDEDDNKLLRGGDTITVWEVTGSFPYSPLGFLAFLGLGTMQVSVSHAERAISETPPAP